MDLRAYYRKVREIGETIHDPYVVVVSHETPDGGRAGERSEVSRGLAAQLIAQGKARLASPAEAQAFHSEAESAREQVEEERLGRKVQLAVVSEDSFRKMKENSRKGAADKQRSESNG